MTDLDFTIDMTEFMAAIKKLGDTAQPALEQAAETGVAVAHGWILEEMGKPKTGKTYVLYQQKGRQRHVASSPGEAPGMDTGALANSITPKKHDSGRDFAIWDLLVGQDYGIHLEFGTKYMAPRPYLRRSFDENRNLIFQAVRSIIGKWIERA